ncbi:ribosome silencing factor [Candidatus Cryosericum odellii]|jgi:ribosome-associated protein|uniref:Ribosome silencing factor n=1 Tax=Candidatus Cryosericum odellii TaxID=2290917 RepID=A0A398DA31_9BACT|nr:ribosome silencing factor [Candidatus Cryosericum odellii]RIE08573.1 ribosome silencing factor [Candidatus Cryosericum odellii]RIE11403.1 ribosome silencing factor [Candidatus Cryosericum odellii]
MNGKRLANRIVNECEKMGVEAVRLIDVRKRTPFFDFLVIATVDNTVLADALLRKMAKTVELDVGVTTFTESSPASDWVVCDYGDTVFHVFVGADVRERYDLEGLWSQSLREGRRAVAVAPGDTLDAE